MDHFKCGTIDKNCTYLYVYRTLFIQTKLGTGPMPNVTQTLPLNEPKKLTLTLPLTPYPKTTPKIHDPPSWSDIYSGHVITWL